MSPSRTSWSSALTAGFSVAGLSRRRLLGRRLLGALVLRGLRHDASPLQTVAAPPVARPDRSDRRRGRPRWLVGQRRLRGRRAGGRLLRCRCARRRPRVLAPSFAPPALAVPLLDPPCLGRAVGRPVARGRRPPGGPAWRRRPACGWRSAWRRASWPSSGSTAGSGRTGFWPGRGARACWVAVCSLALRGLLGVDALVDDVLLAEGPQVVRHPVEQHRQRQERRTDDDADREDVEHQLVHDRGLRVLALRRGLAGHRVPRGDVGEDARRDHQRDHHDEHRRDRGAGGVERSARPARPSCPAWRRTGWPR